LIISTCIWGFIIGALGRAAVPGPSRLGCLGTILAGLLGSILGGAVAGLLFSHPRHHALITFVLQVAGAALIVTLVTRGRRRMVA